MAPADGLGLDFYERDFVRAFDAVRAEYRRLLFEANTRADALGRELNERNQLLQDVDIVLSGPATAADAAALRKRIAKLSKKGGRRT